MPAHDWTRVGAGIFHHFHCSWITALTTQLNSGVLPKGYYALAEQHVGEWTPDILALQVTEGAATPPPAVVREPAVAYGAPPIAAPLAPATRASIVARAERPIYTQLRRTVAIRSTEGDRLAALIEILSPGNKASRRELDRLLGKLNGALDAGVHLLVVDLFPPGPLDPDGVHGLVWQARGMTGFHPPDGKPLLAVAYEAGPAEITAYIEPFQVGVPLPELPLFLAPQCHVRLALEPSYQTAFGSVPERWQKAVQ